MDTSRYRSKRFDNNGITLLKCGHEEFAALFLSLIQQRTEFAKEDVIESRTDLPFPGFCTVISSLLSERKFTNDMKMQNAN